MSFLAERLRSQTSDLAELLTRRIQELRDREKLLSCIKCDKDFELKSSFLEPDEYAAVGIDSMDYDELLEMLLFYVFATGFTCKFTVGKEIHFCLAGVERDKRLAASASVPLWTEDLFRVTDETDAFSLSYDLLDKTTDLETGDWLFISYKGTKQRNVPILVKTPNNEKILISNLSKDKTD